MVEQQHDRLIRWRSIAAYALASTLIVGLGLLARIHGAGGGDPLVVILPGSDGPSAEVFEADFPKLDFPSKVGHDGQQVYAIARDPWNLDAVAPHLDRPTYRLGRPLLSWLGWVAHPSGGGTDLAWALISLEVLGVFGFAVAGGALMQLCGGRAQWAAVFPLLPGTLATLAITTADVFATGLLVGAIAATMRRRYVLAMALGALAILAKESVALPLGIFLLASVLNRTRGGNAKERLRTLANSREARVGIAALLPWLLWSIWIRIQLGAETNLLEFGLPFEGLIDGWQLRWSRGEDLVALLTVSLTYAVAVRALIRTRHSWAARPLWWTVIAQMAFTSTFTVSVVALDYNGTRTTLPLLVLAVAAGLAASRDETDQRQPLLSSRRPTPV